MLIDIIYHAIKNWKTLIDSYKSGNEEGGIQIIKYLNQGSHFSIQDFAIETASATVSIL